jgi:mono/diheme cytochrome c family protein
MRRWTLPRWLGAALVVSIGLNVAAWTARWPRTRLNFEYVPEMARTARFNAFEENPNFPDGMTLRAPVPGTIPRGLPPLPATSAAATQPNPFAADDRKAMDRGAFVFATFCQPCHGTNGEGTGLVVKHGFAAPPPLYRPQTREKSDADLFAIVTSGLNTMPSYASQISRDDRWRAILFLRTLRPTPREPQGRPGADAGTGGSEGSSQPSATRGSP